MLHDKSYEEFWWFKGERQRERAGGQLLTTTSAQGVRLVMALAKAGGSLRYNNKLSVYRDNMVRLSLSRSWSIEYASRLLKTYSSWIRN
jgi:hypothetical protein